MEVGFSVKEYRKQTFHFQQVFFFFLAVWSLRHSHIKNKPKGRALENVTLAYASAIEGER